MKDVWGVLGLDLERQKSVGRRLCAAKGQRWSERGHVMADSATRYDGSNGRRRATVRRLLHAPHADLDDYRRPQSLATLDNDARMRPQPIVKVPAGLC